jgi:hypothetical protein
MELRVEFTSTCRAEIWARAVAISGRLAKVDNLIYLVAMQ